MPYFITHSNFRKLYQLVHEIYFLKTAFSDYNFLENLYIHSQYVHTHIVRHTESKWMGGKIYIYHEKVIRSEIKKENDIVNVTYYKS